MTSNSKGGSVGSHFNNDINIDVLWHHSVSGANMAWLMNGTSRASSASLPSLAGWDLEGINDFNGDGETDILWRNYATGENRVWFMNDTSVSQSVNLASLKDPNWRVGGTGDFNADGKTDILWRNYKTGTNTVWLMNGTSRMSGNSMQALSDVNWRIEGTGDFNADGNSDIVWRNYKTGANTVWFMNGTSRIGSSPIQALRDVNWQIEGTGDFNNDGRTDILWRNYSTGANAAWFMNGTSRTSEVALATVKDTRWKPLVQSSITLSQPDLVVQSQYAPSSATLGDTITISGYTKNNGQASAGYSYIRYWLSDDATLNTSTDRYLGEDYVASLSAGSSEYDTFDFTYNSSWGTGTKYIFFQADGYNYVTEGNESNNTAYRTINIAPPSPSVTVTSPNGGNTLQMGQSYNITWSDNFSDNVRIWLYKGSEYLQTIVDSTESDGSYTWTLPTNLTPGSDYKVAVGIPSSTVTVYDFSDNNFSVVAPSQPDLVVQSQYAPSSVVAGDTISISASVLNQGTGSAGSSNLKYYLSNDTTLDANDIYLGYDVISSLTTNGSGSGSHSFTYNSAWGTGTKYILFKADADSTVAESNEFNNVAYRTVNVATPSVTVTSPNGGNTLQMGQSYNITWSDNFSDNVRIELYKGSSLIQTISSSTSSNGSFTWTPPTALVAGNDYRIKISSASNSSVSDYSDTYFTLAAPSQPDLVIQSQLAPSSVVAGDLVTISASVVNQGTGGAAGNNLKYYLSNDTTLDVNDIYLGYDFISSLAANGSGFGSHSFTYSSTWGTGTKYILFQADADSSVAESNESNNAAYRSINVAAPSVTVTAPNGGNTLQIGQSYNITWSDNFSDNVRIELYKGSSLIQTISSSTPSNGSFTWTPSTSLTAGSDYRIKITNTSNSSVTDFSNSYFTINQLDNGFNIQIDYRFDTQGWFTSEKKAALEAAVNIWESIILDEFNNKPVGTITPYVRNPETGGYVGQQHSDGSWTYTLDQEIDDLLIFVGARELGGSTLGTAGSSGNFTNEIRYTGDDFEPWIGSMAFDITTNWFFDSSPLTSTDIPPEASDFISVAVHEIGHILGITYNSNGTRSSFNRHVSGGFFYGSNAVAQNGGNPIPLEPSLSHIQDGYKYGNWGENALDPTITSGKRKLPTILDIAMMDDIGYDVDYSRAYRNA